MPTSAECFYLNGLSVQWVELRLIIKGIHMTGPTVHEKKDYRLCLGWERRCLWSKRIDEIWYLGHSLGGEETILSKHPSKPEGSEPTSNILDEFPPVELVTKVWLILFHD